MGKSKSAGQEPAVGFKLTQKQEEANELLAGQSTHVLLRGGSRSGKTFLILRAIAIRAMRAPKSRHACLRFRFNASKTKLAMDTWPKMMELCFPSTKYHMNREDWFAVMPNGSEVWFGGLDDKLRAEKILGGEFATIFLNECSEIPWGVRGLALTRLAQAAKTVDGNFLALRMWYDCNPPDKTHWTYRLFIQKVDPDTKRALTDASMYASMQMNPGDNVENLPAEYIGILRSMSSRLQLRFLEGEFRDRAANSLFADEDIDKWRVMGDVQMPDLYRVVVAVDPSGATDEYSEGDAIGIVVAGIGTDGNAYLLEDLTVTAGPAVWGKVATDAYDRHQADCIVGEANYGGAMVQHVIQTARARTPYRAVTATRGKAVRAGPVSSLVEQGRVRFVGFFPELEEELSGFTQHAYVGDRSPNRADAFIWAITELFPGVVSGPRETYTPPAEPYYESASSNWMEN